jgi:hypothetical protein
MASLRKAALRRRLAVLTEAARDKVRRRELLRDQAAALVSIRAALAEAKIDPTRIWALRSIDLAERTLSRLGDTPKMRQADGVFIAHDAKLAAREGYAAICARQAPRFAGGPPPDAGASLFDWYAWSLASPAQEQAKQSKACHSGALPSSDRMRTARKAS